MANVPLRAFGSAFASPVFPGLQEQNNPLHTSIRKDIAMNNATRPDSVKKPVADEATPEKLEKLDQQRMDGESPAAKDAPLPGEHVTTKKGYQTRSDSPDKRQTPNRRE
jgi:hypothetical protein